MWQLESQHDELINVLTEMQDRVLAKEREKEEEKLENSAMYSEDSMCRPLKLNTSRIHENFESAGPQHYPASFAMRQANDVITKYSNNGPRQSRFNAERGKPLEFYGADRKPKATARDDSSSDELSDMSEANADASQARGRERAEPSFRKLLHTAFIPQQDSYTRKLPSVLEGTSGMKKSLSYLKRMPAPETNIKLSSSLKGKALLGEKDQTPRETKVMIRPKKYSNLLFTEGHGVGAGGETFSRRDTPKFPMLGTNPNS